MKMANAINVVRSDEIGLKKSKVFEVPKSTLTNKLNCKETDRGKMMNTRLFFFGNQCCPTFLKIDLSVIL